MGADYYKQRCEHPKDHDEADLCQQWRAANAAEENAAVAHEQALASYLQIGGLLVTVILSLWAAIASHRAAHAAATQLEHLEIPTLSPRFQEFGVVIDSDDRVDFPNLTTIYFRNYGRVPAWIRGFKAEFHLRRPEDGLPPPLDWLSGIGRILPFGVMAPVASVESGDEANTAEFPIKARDTVSETQAKALGKEGLWYLQGQVFFADTTPRGVYVLLFCYMWEDGAFRIAQENWRTDRHYNRSFRFKRLSKAEEFARGLAKTLRWTADKLAPPPHKK